jgi:nicotinate (nicotinamide) nucleotide adenylyltransferase
MDPQVKIIKKAQAGIVTHAEGPSALGVLGGLFNPITKAHLALAEKARHEFSLDEVVFVLPKIPPHKEFFGASPADRLAMMELALAAHDRFSVGLSTHGLFVDIHRGLEKVYPTGVKAYFITGTDAAERILAWQYTDPAQALADMFRRFELIVAQRGSAFQIPPDPLAPRYADKIHTMQLPAEYSALSSTLVREYIRQGRPISHLVPEPVERFIIEKEIYK